MKDIVHRATQISLLAAIFGAVFPATSSATTPELGIAGSVAQAAMVGTPSSIQAGDLTILVNAQGQVTRLTGSDGNDYLASGYTPALLKLIVADSPGAAASTAEELLPTSASLNREAAKPNQGSYAFSYTHGIEATVRLVEHATGYASLELTAISNPQGKDIRVAMWGPYELSISEQVADVVGVAYSRDFAIGIQAANEKTFAGAPYEFTDSSEQSSFDRSADAVHPALGTGIGGERSALNKYWMSAGRLTTFGSVLQAYSRDYTASRRMKVLDIDFKWPTRLVEAITDTGHPLYPVRQLTGSKIALFGLQRRLAEAGGLNRRQVFQKEILRVIRAIERGESLPYTTGNGGVWGKFAEGHKAKVLHYYNNGNHTADVLSAGMNSLYIWVDPAGVFRHNGFEYTPMWGSAQSLRNSINTVQSQGVMWGNHILPGFAVIAPTWQRNRPPSAAPIDRYISRRPGDLGASTQSTTVGSLTASDTSITVAGRDSRFRAFYWGTSSDTRRGYVRIGSEIIAYTGVADAENDNTRLTGVFRGAFRTTAASHEDGSTIYALSAWSGYNSFVWGSATVKEQAEAVAASINNTGMRFISLDGIESYWFDMYGQLAANVFYKTLFENLNSKELSSEASRLWHYNWHFHDRFMWGEKDRQMLLGTVDYQFANTVMRSRNFLPAHTGGFFGAYNTVKDFGWLGSKIAAMDAGTLVRTQGLDDQERASLKRWNEAAEAGAFSDLQQARMLPWNRAFALDRVQNGLRWRLWERGMTLTYDNTTRNNAITRVSYGRDAGGAPTEKTNPFYVARPWAGFSTRNVAGDALVTASSKRDPGFQGANVVDGQIGYLVNNENVYLQSTDRRRQNLYQHSEVSEWQTAADDSARWIQLTWDSPQRVRAVLVSDRSHPGNNVTGYRLEFSSGPSVTGTPLPTRGRYQELSFTPRETTWLKVVITSHQGSTPGLGEIVVIADDPDFNGHLTSNASIESGYSGSDGSKIFDGDPGATNLIDLGEGLKTLVIDLGDEYWVDGLNAWHYYDPNSLREYKDVIYQLSPVADFSSGVTTVFNNDADNSAGQGAGEDIQFQERSEGKPVYFPPVKARYVRMWSNGSTANTSNHYTEVEVYGMRNLAAGKAVAVGGTASTQDSFGRPYSVVTDGDFTAEDSISLGDDLRYLQIDLGETQRVDSLRVWHHPAVVDRSDLRRYRDVVFQLSNDSTFNSGVTTVFNNDLDNSAGLGSGTDGEYNETATGKIVHFAPVSARYVRLYSNGNNLDDSNRYTEVMVGQGGGVAASPKAVDDSFGVSEDTPKKIQTSALLQNDVGASASFVSADSTSAEGGTVVLGSDGALTYTPPENFNGEDSFDYVARLTSGTTTAEYSATVTIYVVAVDDPLIAEDDEAIVNEDGIVQMDVLANDWDPDAGSGDVGARSPPQGVQITVVRQPQHGLATVVDGVINYDHDGGETVSDSLSYTLTNGADESNEATVSLTIIPVNDAPTVAKPMDDVTLRIGRGMQSFDLSQVFFDPDSALTFESSESVEGVVECSLDGTLLQVTPVSAGELDITIVASDGDDANRAVDSFAIEVPAASADSKLSELEISNVSFQDGLVYADGGLDPLHSKIYGVTGDLTEQGTLTATPRDELAAIEVTSDGSGNLQEDGSTVIPGEVDEADGKFTGEVYFDKGFNSLSVKVTPEDTPTHDPTTYSGFVARSFGEKDVVGLHQHGNTKPYGLWGDGETLWVSNGGTRNLRKLFAYDLTDRNAVVWKPGSDIQVSLDDVTSISGIWSNGETMWVQAVATEGTLLAYSLSDGTRDGDKDIPTEGTGYGLRGLWGDGQTIWAVDRRAKSAKAFSIASKSRDADKDISFALPDDVVDNRDLWGIWSDGTTLWVADAANNKAHAYDAGTFATSPDDDIVPLGGGWNDATDIWSDGTTLWVADCVRNPAFGRCGGYGHLFSHERAFPSSNASLVLLALPGVDIGEFDPDVTSYTGEVGHDTSRVTVSAFAADGGSVAIDVGDADETKEGYQADLIAGQENAIGLTVTAADKTTTKTYALTVSRESAPPEDPDPLNGGKVNSSPKGQATVTGETKVGSTLTAGTDQITDEDGMLGATFTYQWVRVTANAETDIAGANASTYVLTADDVGATIKVSVFFTDDGGTDERVDSVETGTVAQADFAAQFRNVPETHNGSAFSFTLEFSENVAGLSYKTLRDGAFDVVGGSIDRATRANPSAADSSKEWSRSGRYA